MVYHGPTQSHRFPGISGCKAYYQVEGDTIWVTFTSDLPHRIPASALDVKSLDPPHYPQTFDDWGAHIPIEPARSPDWYRRDLHYFTWAPSPKAGQWYDISASGSLTGVLETGKPGSWRVPLQFGQRVRQECGQGTSIIQAWWSDIKKQEPRLKLHVPLPESSIDLHALNATFDSEKLLREGLAIIQRQFVGVLGALRWLLLIDTNWESSLTKMMKNQGCGPVFDSFVDWGLLKLREGKYGWVSGGRGLLFDPVQDWRHVSLPLYITNDIPVSYPWTLDVQRKPRFRALSPRQTAAEPIGPDSHFPSWYAELGESDHFNVFFTDKYLQAKFDETIPPVEVEVGNQKRGLPMGQLIVNFEHWKPHTTMTKEDKKRIFNTCFRKEIAHHGNSRNPVFKRFMMAYRPYTNAGCDSDSDMDDYEGKFAPLETIVLREVYKFSYAPPIGQKYLCSQLHLGSSQNEDHPEEAEDLPSLQVFVPPAVEISPSPMPVTSALSSVPSSVPLRLEPVIPPSPLPPATSYRSPSRLAPPPSPDPHPQIIDHSCEAPGSPMGPDLMPYGGRDFSEEAGEVQQDVTMFDLAGVVSLSPAPTRSDAQSLPPTPSSGGDMPGTLRVNTNQAAMCVDRALELQDSPLDLEDSPLEQEDSPVQQELAQGKRSTANAPVASTLLARVSEPRDTSLAPFLPHGRPSQPNLRVPKRGRSPTPEQDRRLFKGEGRAWSSPRHSAGLRPQRLSGYVQTPPERLYHGPPPFRPASASSCPEAGQQMDRRPPAASFRPTSSHAAHSQAGPSSSMHPPSVSSGSRAQAWEANAQPPVDYQIREAKGEQADGHWGGVDTFPAMSWNMGMKSTIIHALPVPLSSIPNTGPWNDEFFERARLHFQPDHAASSEALMRLIWVRNKFNVKYLLSAAVRLGIPFQAAMSFQDLQEFALGRNAPPTPRYYSTDYKDPIPTFDSDAAAFPSWVVTAENLLRREHARSALYNGGLLWRIAVEIRPELLTEVTKGPSCASILWARRQLICPDRHVEAISQDDINTLLGQAKKGHTICTYFPTEAQFFGMIQWRGYWDDRCEQWFKQRWGEIQSGGERHASNAWKRKLKTSNKILRHGPALQAILEELQKENLGVSWVDKPIGRLSRDQFGRF